MTFAHQDEDGDVNMDVGSSDVGNSHATPLLIQQSQLSEQTATPPPPPPPSPPAHAPQVADVATTTTTTTTNKEQQEQEAEHEHEQEGLSRITPSNFLHVNVSPHTKSKYQPATTDLPSSTPSAQAADIGSSDAHTTETTSPVANAHLVATNEENTPAPATTVTATATETPGTTSIDNADTNATTNANADDCEKPGSVHEEENTQEQVDHVASEHEQLQVQQNNQLNNDTASVAHTDDTTVQFSATQPSMATPATEESSAADPTRKETTEAVESSQNDQNLVSSVEQTALQTGSDEPHSSPPVDSLPSLPASTSAVVPPTSTPTAPPQTTAATTPVTTSSAIPVTTAATVPVTTATTIPVPSSTVAVHAAAVAVAPTATSAAMPAAATLPEQIPANTPVAPTVFVPVASSAMITSVPMSDAPGNPMVSNAEAAAAAAVATALSATAVDPNQVVHASVNLPPPVPPAAPAGTSANPNPHELTEKKDEEEVDIMDLDSDEAEERVLRPKPKKRARQHTNLISERFVATKWMIDHSTVHGETNIKSKAVRRFPRIFTGSEKAALQKASRWWKSRHTTLALRDPDVKTGSVTAHMKGGATRSPMKALPGRGRRRAKWVSSLHNALLKEYERLHVTGLKVSSSILQSVAKELLIKAPNDSDYSKEVKAQDGIPIINKINARWIDQFLHAHEIVLRWPTNRGNRRASVGAVNASATGAIKVENGTPGAEVSAGSVSGRRVPLEKHVAFHLGQLKRGFEDGLFDDDMMESAGDIRFIMNLPSGRSLGLLERELREEDIPCLSSHTRGELKPESDTPDAPADSQSGAGEVYPQDCGEQVSVLLRLRAGEFAKVETPLVVFSDKLRTYPLEGVVDSVPGACYRTSPEASLDWNILLQWLRDSRTMTRLNDGKKKHLFMDDSCERMVYNAEIQDSLQSLNIELHNMPRNVTELLQPGRSMIVPEFRKLWKRHWELYVAECGTKGLLIRDESTGIERAPMPEKRFYLEVAASVVDQLNSTPVDDSINLARNAMIKTGLSKNVNGRWEVSQLSDELKMIVARYRNHFEGEPVQDGLTPPPSTRRRASAAATAATAAAAAAAAAALNASVAEETSVQMTDVSDPALANAATAAAAAAVTATPDPNNITSVADASTTNSNTADLNTSTAGAAPVQDSNNVADVNSTVAADGTELSAGSMVRRMNGKPGMPPSVNARTSVSAGPSLNSNLDAHHQVASINDMSTGQPSGDVASSATGAAVAATTGTVSDAMEQVDNMTAGTNASQAGVELGTMPSTTGEVGAAGGNFAGANEINDANAMDLGTSEMLTTLAPIATENTTSTTVGPLQVASNDVGTTTGNHNDADNATEGSAIVGDHMTDVNDTTAAATTVPPIPASAAVAAAQAAAAALSGGQGLDNSSDAIMNISNNATSGTDGGAAVNNTDDKVHFETTVPADAPSDMDLEPDASNEGRAEEQANENAGEYQVTDAAETGTGTTTMTATENEEQQTAMNTQEQSADVRTGTSEFETTQTTDAIDANNNETNVNDNEANENMGEYATDIGGTTATNEQEQEEIVRTVEGSHVIASIQRTAVSSAQVETMEMVEHTNNDANATSSEVKIVEHPANDTNASEVEAAAGANNATADMEEGQVEHTEVEGQSQGERQEEVTQTQDVNAVEQEEGPEKIDLTGDDVVIMTEGSVPAATTEEQTTTVTDENEDGSAAAATHHVQEGAESSEARTFES